MMERQWIEYQLHERLSREVLDDEDDDDDEEDPSSDEGDSRDAVHLPDWIIFAGSVKDGEDQEENRSAISHLSWSEEEEENNDDELYGDLPYSGSHIEKAKCPSAPKQRDKLKVAVGSTYSVVQSQSGSVLVVRHHLNWGMTTTDLESLEGSRGEWPTDEDTPKKMA
jgi:hypothetical protein